MIWTVVQVPCPPPKSREVVSVDRKCRGWKHRGQDVFQAEALSIARLEGSRPAEVPIMGFGGVSGTASGGGTGVES